MVQDKTTTRIRSVIPAIALGLSWLVGCSAFLGAPTRAVAQDTELELAESGQEHEMALRQQIRSLLQQANDLQAQGDAAQALLLRNRAKSLFRSLQAMQDARSAGKDQRPTEELSRENRPTLTKADAVLAMHRCIEVLKLLGEAETARPIERVLNRIATPSEVREIVNYYRNQPTADPDATGDSGKTPAQGHTSDVPEPGQLQPEPSPPRNASTEAPHLLAETPEALENEIAALKLAMETLLENDRADAGRILAEGLMLRGRALRSGELTWQYPSDQFPVQEIDAVRMAATLMYRDQNVIQARILRDLATLLADRQRPRPKANRGTDDDESVTRLLRRIQELELENRRLRSKLEKSSSTPENAGPEANR